jgi:hypothetical protein
VPKKIPLHPTAQGKRSCSAWRSPHIAHLTILVDSLKVWNGRVPDTMVWHIRHVEEISKKLEAAGGAGRYILRSLAWRLTHVKRKTTRQAKLSKTETPHFTILHSSILYTIQSNRNEPAKRKPRQLILIVDVTPYLCKDQAMFYY